MANQLTDEDFDEAQSLYRRMAAAQTKLWELSLELEGVIGCAVDTTEDFNVVDLHHFIEKNEAI